MKEIIKIGITGHRDIVQTVGLRKSIKIYLKSLIMNNPKVEFVLLSPLADGADRLVADIFLELKQEVYR